MIEQKNRKSILDYASSQEQADLWARIIKENGMISWPAQYEVLPGYPPDEVQRACVQHKEWQTTRLSMKGKTTSDKLKILVDWWKTGIDEAENAGEMSSIAWRSYEVQVGNYLGALRRGGQLDAFNRVRKYK